MKTIKKTLFRKEYKSPVAWGYKKEHEIIGYVEYNLWFDFKEGLRFSVSVPNSSFCSNNPFECLLRMVEQQNVGMLKYDEIKYLSRRQGIYKKLDPEFKTK